jgi:hypothetical protein
MARPATGTNLNIAELQRILDQRKSQLSKLLKQRTRAQRELDALERSIAKLEGGGGMGRRGGGGGRARNEVSLNETLRKILEQAGKPMSVGDLEAAALAAGYRSSSANFRGIINQQLIKDRGFSQVGRGVYELKGGAKGGGRGKSKKEKGGESEQAA